MEVRKRKLVANWRELFKEWGIIVLGVLTALLAEQAVQSIEWRHKVDVAIGDMTQEMANGNGPEAYARLAMHDCLADRLSAARTAVEIGDRMRSRQFIGTVWLPNRTYEAQARDSANGSDVGSHMPTMQMRKFRIVYALIPEMDRLNDKELSDLARLRALPASGGPVQQLEKLATIGAIEDLQLDNDRMARGATFTLRVMRAGGIRLNRPPTASELRDANAHYAGCLKLAPVIPAASTSAFR
jgi:hypothetical protein